MKSRQAGNSKVWVLVAVLAAAIGAVLYVGGIFPPGEQNVSGTIVPAERYRANQINSDDVVLGDEEASGSGSTQTEQLDESAGLAGKGLDGKGLDGKGLDGKGLDGKGLDGKGLDGKGLDGKGLDGKGLDAMINE